MSQSWKQDPTEIPSRIEVFLAVPDHEPALCRVECLTIRGATVKMKSEDAPLLGVGATAELLITDTPSSTSVVIPAATEVRSDKNGIRTYRVRFTDIDAAEGLLHPGLAQLFERREAYRANPDRNNPVMVKLTPPDSASPSLSTHLVDLSISGLAIDVSVEFETEMIPFDELTVTFSIGGEEVELVASIRHRSWKEHDRVRYGLEFRQDNQALAVATEKISAWVLRRQLTLSKNAA